MLGFGCVLLSDRRIRLSAEMSFCSLSNSSNSVFSFVWISSGFIIHDYIYNTSSDILFYAVVLFL